MSGEALRRAIRVFFWLSIAANALVLVFHPLLAGHESIPVESATERRHVLGHSFYFAVPRARALLFSDDVLLCEDGVPLPFPDATSADIAALGSGRYVVFAKRTVYFSIRDDGDPFANGRRYTLEVTTNAVYSLPALALAALSCVLAVLAWRTGGVRLHGVSPPKERAFVTLVTLASLLGGLSHGWDRIAIDPDSLTYVTHSPVRPFLYPAFIDAFDRSPGEPRDGIVPCLEDWAAPRDTGNRFLGVVHAQKVLTVVAIATLVLALSGGINAWLLCALVYLAVLWDLRHGAFLAINFNLNCVLSEGLNHALVFFYLASVFSYARKPAVWRGAALALLVALLVLTRPVNVALGLAFALVFVVHLREGWKKAAVRATALGLLAAAPLLLACGVNARNTGHFKLHAFTGWVGMHVAPMLATEDDVASFEDPKDREFMRIVVIENAAMRKTDYTPETIADIVNANLYKNAVPAFDRVYKTPPGELPDYYRDAVFGRISSHVFARHKAAYLRYVLFNISIFLSPLHAIILPLALYALLLYRRKGEYQHLFFAFFATIPFVLLLLTSVFQPPGDRYQAPLGFAETFAPLLFLAILATRAISDSIPTWASSSSATSMTKSSGA